jgi:hypothetical protein
VDDQDRLFEVPELEQAEQQRVSFGRYLKPEMYDIFGEYDLSQVTEDEAKWMTPKRIARELFAESPRSPVQGFVVDGILLNQFEYRLVPRSPEALGTASLSKVLGDNDIDADLIERAKRGRVHALGSKIDAMATHSEKLHERRENIVKLQKLAYRPGHGNVLPDQSPDTVKFLFAEAWSEFTNILDVLQVQREWTQDQRTSAEAALINYLTQGPQRDRVMHWREMLVMARTYLVARTYLLQKRTKQTLKLLDSYPALEDDDATEPI